MAAMYLACIVFFALTGGSAADQSLVDYLSEHLQITYTVVDCASSWSYTASINITNTGSQTITDSSWHIYFSHIRMIEPDLIRPNGTALGDSGLMVYHVNGVHFRMAPGPEFQGFLAGQTVEALFNAEAWQISRTDSMPNWYVVADGAQPGTLTSTVGKELSFVTDFTSEAQWKRHPDDLYNPYTAEERLARQTASVQGSAPIHIIPSPVVVDLSATESVHLGSDVWLVVYATQKLEQEADMLADKMGLRAVAESEQPESHYIRLELGEVINAGELVVIDEAYSLVINTNSTIIITGRDCAGAFYGSQSLLSLVAGSASSHVPVGSVVDYPRFHYRGQHIDVSRNFYPVEAILRHLDVMATYKLNKLHLHLTDDEGWRLEIPGLPELTTVGSKRCYDPSGDRCILPQLGSGHSQMTSGTGHYTTEDYKLILQNAKDRHIQVIPEFDLPGHAHAPINAMLSRYRDLKDSNMTAATEFLLSDLEDTSDYLSIQYFTDNAVNPCIESTYSFVEHVMMETIKLHQDIQPLTEFNFGGDEVPKGAWVNSTACQSMRNDGSDLDTAALKEEFAYRVAEIANKHNLDISAWEDGLMEGFHPFNRSRIPNTNAKAYMWDNVWEWGRGQRSYLMANQNFQVVLSHATHLYFDHPYEPDPEERGYYWATRITPTRKTHSFAPHNIYQNMLVDGNGREIDREDICDSYGCEELLDGQEQFVIGMQGHLWSETVRTSEQLDYMIFPRAIALAERAWHKAAWEHMPEGREREVVASQDWSDFANTLGYKELSRLDQLSVAYRVPPPGAAVDVDLTLVAESEYPGLPIQYSCDGGGTWTDYSPGVKLNPGNTVELRTLSASRNRWSRQVSIQVPSDSVDNSAIVTSSYVILMVFIPLGRFVI